MNLPSWMYVEAPRRDWVDRTRGRRKSDRRPRIETILGAVVLGAWAWGAYEMTLLFIHS
jgi:hypothetical protein